MKQNRRAVDFIALRKKRLMWRRTRQMLLIIGITLLVLTGVYLSEMILQHNMTTSINDIIGTFGGEGYPIPLPGGVIRDVKQMGSNVAVLNDTNLYIYSKNGKQLQNVQRMTDKTILITSTNRALAYDYGARTLSIHSSGRTLHTHEFDETVLGADLGEGGEYAVVTSPRHYIAKVSAYNRDFAPMMHWYSPDQFVLGVTVSPRGNMMVVATVDGEGGVLESDLYFLRFGQEQASARIVIGDELVTWLDFHNENRLAVLTEKSYRLYDQTGTETAIYTLPVESPLAMFDSNGDRTIFICGTKEAREFTMIMLDAQGREIASAKTEGRLIDLALANRELYVLTDKGILHYNSSLEQRSVTEVIGAQRIMWSDNRLYCLTADEIGIYEENKQSVAEQRSEAAVQE